jgi:hypothetical protein
MEPRTGIRGVARTRFPSVNALSGFLHGQGHTETKSTALSRAFFMSLVASRADAEEEPAQTRQRVRQRRFAIQPCRPARIKAAAMESMQGSVCAQRERALQPQTRYDDDPNAGVRVMDLVIVAATTAYLYR